MLVAVGVGANSLGELVQEVQRMPHMRPVCVEDCRNRRRSGEVDHRARTGGLERGASNTPPPTGDVPRHFVDRGLAAVGPVEERDACRAHPVGTAGLFGQRGSQLASTERVFVGLMRTRTPQTLPGVKFSHESCVGNDVAERHQDVCGGNLPSAEIGLLLVRRSQPEHVPGPILHLLAEALPAVQQRLAPARFNEVAPHPDIVSPRGLPYSLLQRLRNQHVRVLVDQLIAVPALGRHQLAPEIGEFAACQSVLGVQPIEERRQQSVERGSRPACAVVAGTVRHSIHGDLPRKRFVVHALSTDVAVTEVPSLLDLRLLHLVRAHGPNRSRTQRRRPWGGLWTASSRSPRAIQT